MVITLVIISIVGIVALILVLNTGGDDKKPTIDEQVENSIDTDEITTDLNDGGFVRIQFKIVTDSKEAKEELEKRSFQLNNIVIKELSKKDQEQFKTGIGNLESTLQTRLNEVMTEGKVTDVYTTQKVLQ